MYLKEIKKIINEEIELVSIYKSIFDYYPPMHSMINYKDVRYVTYKLKEKNISFNESDFLMCKTNNEYCIPLIFIEKSYSNFIEQKNKIEKGYNLLTKLNNNPIELFKEFSEFVNPRSFVYFGESNISETYLKTIMSFSKEPLKIKKFLISSGIFIPKEKQQTDKRYVELDYNGIILQGKTNTEVNDILIFLKDEIEPHIKIKKQYVRSIRNGKLKSHVAGYFLPKINSIIIDPNNCSDHTFIHEYIHAVDFTENIHSGFRTEYEKFINLMREETKDDRFNLNSLVLKFEPKEYKTNKYEYFVRKNGYPSVYSAKSILEFTAESMSDYLLKSQKLNSELNSICNKYVSYFK